MKFTVPKNPPDLIFYIWKIIDMPSIALDDLIYKISFEMLLFSPDEAEKFILKALESKLIHKDEIGEIKLSDDLFKKLNQWHIKRKKEISHNFEAQKGLEKIKDDFSKNKLSKFNVLMNAFIDNRGILNRAVAISDEALNVSILDVEKGIIKVEVKGSEAEPYIIEISINDKELFHNCHDFENKRARNKKFCKHLVKLFLYLKNQENTSATTFLQAISKDINKWNFNY